MKPWLWFLATVALVSGAGLASSHWLFQRPPHRSYQVIDLGTLAGAVGHLSAATDINDSNQVVGNSTLINSQVTHAFLWQAGTMTDLGVLPEFNTARASSINNSGVIVGNLSQNGGCPCRGFSWDAGTMEYLEGLSNFSNGYAFAINNEGSVAGSSWSSPNASTCDLRPYLDDGTNTTDLGAIGGAGGLAFGINDANQVVGQACVLSSGPDTHAFLYSNGLMMDLGTLGGPWSEAQAINESGATVGTSSYENTSHAFLHEDGDMTDLGTLGGDRSVAIGINAQEHIVGSSDVPSNLTLHAFIAVKDRMWDLNDFIPEGSGWELQGATSINASGHIVGYGRINGRTRAFLLVPAD